MHSGNILSRGEPNVTVPPMSWREPASASVYSHVYSNMHYLARLRMCPGLLWFPRGPPRLPSAPTPANCRGCCRPSLHLPEPLALLVNVRTPGHCTFNWDQAPLPSVFLGPGWVLGGWTDWMYKDGEQRAGNTRDQGGAGERPGRSLPLLPP